MTPHFAWSFVRRVHHARTSSQQPQTSPLLLQQSPLSGLTGQHLSPSLDHRTSLCLPAHSPAHPSPAQGAVGSHDSHSYSSLQASSGLIQRSPPPLSSPPDLLSHRPGLPHTDSRLPEEPKSRPTPRYDLVFGWGSREDRACSAPMCDIIAHSRWPSTRTATKLNGYASSPGRTSTTNLWTLSPFLSCWTTSSTFDSRTLPTPPSAS